MLSSLASVKSPSCNEPSASSATRYGCITTWLLSSNFRSSGFRSRKKSIQMLASAKQIQSCYTQRERRLDWIFPQEKSFLAKVGTGTLSLDLLLNHRSSTLNLRPSARSGIVPSSAARLREASRSISAFNASRSSAVRPKSPLYARARRIKSSSSDTVALIFPPRQQSYRRRGDSFGAFSDPSHFDELGANSHLPYSTKKLALLFPTCCVQLPPNPAQ